MLSKKNYQEKIRKLSNKQNRYSIRKLSIGVASTLIGISFFGFNAHTVHADAAADARAATHVADQSSVASNDNKAASSSTNEAKPSIQSNEVAQSSADQKQADSTSSQVTNNTDTSTLEKTPAGDATGQSNESQSATVQAKNGKGSETQANKNENTPIINTNPEQKESVKPTDTSKAPTPTNKPDDSDTWVIGENNSKTYDGKETNKIDTSKLVLKDNNGKQLNTSSINNDSFQWVDKDGNPISDKIPKDVGIYYIKLTDSALKKLKEENPNVEVSNFTFSYDVKQGTATATLKGYDFESENDVSKAYNTKSQENKSQEIKPLTPVEMIKQGNKIYVDLNIPGLDGEKYKLSDGEYSWLDDDNKPISAPQKNGVYHIILNDKGQTHIRDYIKTLVGKGTELQNGTETEVSDVNVRFDNKLATFYISKKEPAKPTNLPDGTVWTPAGWTRSNPNYAAKESTVKLYESGKELPSNSDKSISKFTKFGTDITAVVDKDDIQVGNKILLATITATNDYAKTEDDQLPLTVSSLLDGTPAHDATTGKIIGKYSVTKQDNGEIDYWLIVTDTDSYSEDVKVTANDSQTGYINANQDFSKLAKLSNGSQQLGPNSVISQQITTASNTYTQTYTLPSAIDNGPTRDNDANNVPKDPGKLWINKSKPTMSGNYLNPALDIKFSNISAISSGTYTEEIMPHSYTKVYSITGDNLDFSNLTTWERLNISPVDGQIKREASNSVPNGNGNNTLLDKNKKAAIKLSDNLTVQDLIAQTPDGQSAYSIQQDGSVTIVVKVNPNDTKLTKTEIDNYVKSSQYYNLQNKDDHTLQDTENFYERLGYQSLVNDVMIGFSLKNSDENRSWVNFTDISPDKKQHPQSVFQSYAHGKNTIQGKYIRTMTIDYVDVDGDKVLSSAPVTEPTNQKDLLIGPYSIILPSGYELVGIEAKNSNSRFQLNNNNSSFTYTLGVNDVPNKNTGIRIKIRKVTNPVTYSVIDDDTDNSDSSSVGTNIQLNGITMLDKSLKDIFSNKGSSNEEAADQDFQDIVKYWESRGYELSKTNPFLDQNGSVDWAKVKNNNYHFDIHVNHIHSIVKNAESKTITRNITVQGIPGINSAQQTITYTRDSDTDLVTGNTTFSDWTTNDNWGEFTPGNVPDGFYIGSIVTDGIEKDYKSGEISTIPGFEAPKSIDDKGIQNIKDTNVLVKYVNDPFNIRLKFIDDDDGGKVISTKKTVSVPGQALSNYSNWFVPEELEGGYDLAQKQETQYIKDAKDANDGVGVTVHLVHKHEKFTDSNTVTRTIEIITPDQKKTTTEQKVEFTRQADHDLAINETTYGEWDKSKATLDKIDVPSVAGYTPSSQVSNLTVRPGYKDTIVTITYSPVDQTSYYQFVDDDATDSTPNINQKQEIIGKTDQKIDLSIAVPDHYVLAQGQTLPTDYAFKAENNAPLIIHLKHKISEDTDSTLDLSKTVTRHIIINYPDGKTTTTDQSVVFTRTASRDEVTHNVTYRDWTVNGKGTWAEYVPDSIAGYSLSQDKVEALTVKANQTDETVNIRYNPNKQSIQVTYVDKTTGQTLRTVNMNGHTNEDSGYSTKDTIETYLNKGYVLVSDSTNGQKLKYDNDDLVDDQNYIVQLEHGTETKQLTNSVTRTIHYQYSDGRQADKDYIDNITFNGSQKLDKVDGQVISTEWDAAPKDFNDRLTKPIKGYNADQTIVSNKGITHDGKPITVTVTYTANDQKGKIVYIDTDNNNVEVGHTDLAGKTDQVVSIAPQVPAGYEVVSGQNIPVSEKATADGISTVTVKVSHHKITVMPGVEPNPGDKISGNSDKKPGDGTTITDITYNDLHKAMTRTVNVTDPHTGLKTTKLTLNYERSATIDDVTGDVTYGDWTVADGSKAGFDNFDIPTVAGYTSEFKAGSADELNAMTPSQDQINNWKDQTVDIDYTANDQSMKITYVDSQGKSVDGGTFIVSGKTDQTVDTNAKIPAGWVLVNGQSNAPETITFSGKPTANIKITIEHGTTNISHNNPVKPGDKTTTGKVISGAHNEDLNQTITRTITIHEPGKEARAITQKAKLFRDATIDDVTGKITYGAWSTDDTNWVEKDVPVHAGYTAHQSDGKNGIPAVTVSDGQQNVNIDITYTANDQTGKIIYQDVDNGNVEVGHTDLAGKTDQDVSITPQIPVGYDLVEHQQIPTSEKATAEGIAQITVKVKHHTTSVDHTKPVHSDMKTVTGKNIQGAHASDLNQTITRTINITDQKGNTSTETQVAHIHRDASYDEVTGKVTYGSWSTDNWSSFTPDRIAGYTPTQSKVDAVTVADGQKDVNVNISYTANGQSMHIKYVDANNNVIKDYAVNGKTDQNVNTNAKIPAGWVLVEGQTDAPEKIAFTGTPTADITIKIKHGTTEILHTNPVKPGDTTSTGAGIKGAFENDLNRNVIRKITIHEPGKEPQTIRQIAHIYRDASYDNVTGEVTYKDWSTDAKNWAEVNIPVNKGYKASQNKVDAVTVGSGQKDVTIDITYTAIPNHHIVRYVDDDKNIVFEDDVTGNDQDEQDYDFNGKLPLGWMFDEDFVVPGKIKMDGSTTQIHIKHATTHVTHDDPKKTDDVLPHNTDAHYPAGVDHDDLNKSVTRKIIVNMPDGKEQVIEQTVKFTRDAEVDEVNGNVSYTDWTLDTNGLIEYLAPIVDGYHANIEKVAGETPTVDSQYDDIQINYAADPAPHDDNNGDTDDSHGKTPVVPGDDNHSSVDNNNGVNNNGDTKTDDDNTDTHKENAFVPQAKQDDPVSENRQTAPISHDSNGSAHKEEKDTAVKKTNAMAFAAPAAKGFLKTKTKQKQGKPSPKKPASAVAPMHALKKETSIKPLAAEKANVQSTKQNVPTKSEKAQAPQAKQQSGNTLPQTGAKQNNSWLGILLSALGLSALFVNRKKKKD